MPHFRENKSTPLQVKEDGELIPPTLNKMTLLAMQELGWVGDIKSVPTFKSKIWASARPHAGAAYALACDCAKRFFSAERQVDGYFFFACLEYPPTIEIFIQRSETYRLMLSGIEQFKIKEEETIQILAEGSPLEFDDSRSAKPDHEARPCGRI